MKDLDTKNVIVLALGLIALVVVVGALFGKSDASVVTLGATAVGGLVGYLSPGGDKNAPSQK